MISIFSRGAQSEGHLYESEVHAIFLYCTEIQKAMSSFTVCTDSEVHKGNPHTTVDYHPIAKLMVKRKMCV